MASAKDAYDQLGEIRKELSNLQHRVTNLYAILNELHLEDTKRPICPDCGLSVKGPSALAEHLYLSHDGDVPDHWLQAETHAALEEATP